MRPAKAKRTDEVTEGLLRSYESVKVIGTSSNEVK